MTSGKRTAIEVPINCPYCSKTTALHVQINTVNYERSSPKPDDYITSHTVQRSSAIYHDCVDAREKP